MYTNPLFHPSPSLSLNLAHVFENEHARAVNKLSFHPKEPNILLSGSQDSTMKIFVCDHHCYYNTLHLQMYVFIVCAHCTQVVYIAVLLYTDLACVHVYIVVMQDYVMLIFVSLLLCCRIQEVGKQCRHLEQQTVSVMSRCVCTLHRSHRDLYLLLTVFSTVS